VGRDALCRDPGADALMAVILRNLIGFETGGLEEAQVVVGSPDATEATIVRSGIRSLKMGAAATPAEYHIENIGDGSGNNNIGFGMYLTDVTPATNIDFWQMFNELATPTRLFSLRFKTDGNIALVDANGTEGASAASGMSVNTFHFIEYFHDTVSNNSVFKVWVDGNLIIDTTDDIDPGGASADRALDGRFIGADNTAGNPDIYFEDFYWYTGGAADASDRLGDAEVFMYQNTVEDATDQGDALADGTWALVGEIPLNEGTSNDAQYVDTGNLTGSTICDSADSNARPGPSGDSNIDGDSNIKAAKWIGRFKRGSGGGRTHNFYGGNDGAGANHATWIASNDAKTLDLDLTTSYQTFSMISESTEVPNSSEDFQYGFSKSATAGQDIFCGEIWAMLLHVPDTGPAVPIPSLVMAPYIST